MTTVMPTGASRDPRAEATRDQSRRRAKAPAVATGAEARPQAGVPAVPTALTVKLTARSMESLARAARLRQVNLTDTVNRAVQLYDLVVTALAENKRNALIITRDGGAERIHVD